MKQNGTINHIEIYVSNLTNSKKFWNWLLVKHLGYKVYQSWSNGISYSINSNYYIVFVQTSEDKLTPSYNRTHVGLNHLAFSISDIQTLKQIRSELQLKGYTELYADKYPHAGGNDNYTLYFEDPDRIKVELVLIAKEDEF